MFPQLRWVVSLRIAYPTFDLGGICAAVHDVAAMHHGRGSRGSPSNSLRRALEFFEKEVRPLLTGRRGYRMPQSRCEERYGEG